MSTASWGRTLSLPGSTRLYYTSDTECHTITFQTWTKSELSSPEGTFLILILGVFVTWFSIFKTFRQVSEIEGTFSFSGVPFAGDHFTGDAAMISCSLFGDKPISLQALLFNLGIIKSLKSGLFSGVLFAAAGFLDVTGVPPG